MKSLFTWMICAALLFTLAGPATYAQAATRQPAANEGKMKSAIVMEEETGKILYQKNANKELPPASMTKVMTLLLIFQALSRHQISLNDKVGVSEYAASMGGSQVFLEPGETMTVDEMLRAIAIASGNDASVAMAEYISGSAKAFVKKMNQEAKKLGLKHTHFENPTGLPVKNHYTTARDMAVMAQALAHYQKVFQYTSKYEDYLREQTDKKFWLVNTNKLIRTYPGADGMKTGFTNEAKYCLTATAKRNGMRVIAVVMGAPSPKIRNQEAAALMTQAFSVYSTRQLLKKGSIVSSERVEKGNLSRVALVTNKPAVLLVKKGEQTKGLKKHIEITKKLQAPIKSGTVVGSCNFTEKGRVVARAPLTVRDNVTRASWWQLFKRAAGSIIGR